MRDIYRVVGTKFHFLGFFWIFEAIKVKTASFQFKRANQEQPHHYRPPAPTAGSSARLSSNAGATAYSGQAVAPPGRALPPATETSLILR
jgi:hypothetical protein